MRDTHYATELVPPARIVFESGDECRLERLLIKELNQEEIRMSWWKEGKIIPRPLDVSESTLTELIAQGIQRGVLSAQFLPKLIVMAAQDLIPKK